MFASGLARWHHANGGKGLPPGDELTRRRSARLLFFDYLLEGL
jgi:hypothetical protein